MLLRFGLFRLDGIAAGRGGVVRLSQTIEQLDNPTQAIDVEQMLCCHCGRNLWRWIVVGTAQGDGNVTPVRGHDDEVRIVPSANSDDLDALALKGMMRMGNGHKSRNWSGWRGSALWGSPRYETGSFKPRCCW
jgi:hypothetical protein